MGHSIRRHHGMRTIGPTFIRRTRWNPINSLKFDNLPFDRHPHDHDSLASLITLFIASYNIREFPLSRLVHVAILAGIAN
jgi:hypothetical protein